MEPRSCLLCGLWSILMSVVMVTSLSVLPDREPRLLKDLFPRGEPVYPPYVTPGPVTLPPLVTLPPWDPLPIPGLKPDPPMVCPCVVRCCTHALAKRSTVTLKRNMPLVRHKRCCGCHPCDWWSKS